MRLENGLQVCWQRITALPAAGSSYLYPVTNFPQPFVSKPLVFLQAVERLDGDLEGARATRYVYRDATTASTTRVMALAHAGANLVANRLLITEIISVGRWK